MLRELSNILSRSGTALLHDVVGLSALVIVTLGALHVPAFL